MTPVSSTARQLTTLAPARTAAPGVRPELGSVARRLGVATGDGERIVVLPPHEVPRGARVLGVVVALPEAPVRRGEALRPVGARAPHSPAVDRVGVQRVGEGSTSGLGGSVGELIEPRSKGPQERELRPGLVLNRTDRTLLRDGEVFVLTRREFDLLDHLAVRPRRVISRSSLLIAVWGATVPLGTRTVDVHVLRLRRKLGAAHSEALQTLRGVGYRWVP